MREFFEEAISIVFILLVAGMSLQFISDNIAKHKEADQKIECQKTP